MILLDEQGVGKTHLINLETEKNSIHMKRQHFLLIFLH